MYERDLIGQRVRISTGLDEKHKPHGSSDNVVMRKAEMRQQALKADKIQSPAKTLQ
jgi:hypothetical protein